MKCKPLFIAVLAVLILLLVPLLNFRMLVFNKAYYSSALDKAEVESKDEAFAIVDYLSGKSALPGGLSEGEVSHMADVKRLIDFFVALFYSVSAAFLALLVFIYATKKDLCAYVRPALLLSSLLIVLLSATLFLLSAHFDFLFDKFHLAFFEQDSWIFPPSGKLVMIFPQSFFYGFFYKILLNSLLFSLTILAALCFFQAENTNIFK